MPALDRSAKTYLRDASAENNPRLVRVVQIAVEHIRHEEEEKGDGVHRRGDEHKFNHLVAPKSSFVKGKTLIFY